ncbi:hypothetical protein, partial [Actinoplanes rectilineatus]
MSAPTVAPSTEMVTVAERKLLTHHQIFPDDSSYNLAFAYRVRGADLPRLTATAVRLLECVAAFNTTFPLHRGRLVRRRHGPGGHHVQVRPLPPGGEAELLRRVSAQVDAPMPPDTFPLAAVELYGDGGDLVYLVIRAAHVVADAYTYYNVFRLASRL